MLRLENEVIVSSQLGGCQQIFAQGAILTCWIVEGQVFSFWTCLMHSIIVYCQNLGNTLELCLKYMCWETMWEKELRKHCAGYISIINKSAILLVRRIFTCSWILVVGCSSWNPGDFLGLVETSVIYADRALVKFWYVWWWFLFVPDSSTIVSADQIPAIWEYS